MIVLGGDMNGTVNATDRRYSSVEGGRAGRGSDLNKLLQQLLDFDMVDAYSFLHPIPSLAMTYIHMVHGNVISGSRLDYIFVDAENAHRICWAEVEVAGALEWDVTDHRMMIVDVEWQMMR